MRLGAVLYTEVRHRMYWRLGTWVRLNILFLDLLASLEHITLLAGTAVDGRSCHHGWPGRPRQLEGPREIPEDLVPVGVTAPLSDARLRPDGAAVADHDDAAM